MFHPLTPHPIAFISMPGGYEWVVIAALGLLIFGKRLPEVGRSLGKGIVEFKRGLKGVEDEIEQVDEEIDRRPKLTQQQQSPAHKYDPYTGKPVEGTAEAESDTASTKSS